MILIFDDFSAFVAGSGFLWGGGMGSPQGGGSLGTGSGVLRRYRRLRRYH